MPYIKFQDSSLRGLEFLSFQKVLRTDRRIDRQADGQAQTNMPPQLLQSWGHKNQLSMTSIKYDHLQVMGTITRQFHQNPLKPVEGVAETRTSVDKMAKTDKGP